ncbi:tyrosine-type recombinase/integrase [Limimaricola cinnabarinus]|uniref:Tyr recombinase domain-containing protein n=1 Tax=Limimaricola cinnabarinus TaxID=1125964 RepID=A0A2G1MLK9_9RHOB|nr:tyrosine-type recombinase/integrase [Limimaricola cinnabarinus]PHP29604.1 hypothetical protein CJ301_00370 [Limimaricola cinnabarinus]
MTLAEDLRKHMELHRESMRALSLRAGLNPKAVSDILTIPGLRPRHSTLAALSSATGRDLSVSFGSSEFTYADLIARAQKADDVGLQSRLRWLCRNAGWAPELKIVCKQDVIQFFDANEPAAFNLSPGSYATYRCQLVAAAGRGTPRARKRKITDIGGVHAALYAAIQGSTLSNSMKYASGAFLLYLHDREIPFSSVCDETLAQYYKHRVADSAKSEAACEKHVREISALTRKLASDPAFAAFGFAAASHPFADRRDKFGVAAADLAGVLAEFDHQVAPWARGTASRDGLTFDDFIARLDAEEATEDMSEDIALLMDRRRAKQQRPGHQPSKVDESRKDRLRQAGFLVGHEVWSERTLDVRRGYLVAAAKALVSGYDMLPRNLDMLLHPKVLRAAIEVIVEANKAEHASGYAEGILKVALKIARDFQQRSPSELQVIRDMIKSYKVVHAGIAPRNKAKLRNFDSTRIQKAIDLTAKIVSDTNSELNRRRKTARKARGDMSTSALLTRDMGQDIMAALAHGILLARAPRSENVLLARLDWITWDEVGARIVIPAARVKMRDAGDADLTILLNVTTSKLLRKYLDVVRPALLQPGQERNPYLFPAQRGDLTKHYSTLLQRVTRLMHRNVGVKIHPHLYRHLIGWIWLRESSDNMLKVQKLLGHRDVETTIKYYAELDEALIGAEWLKYLDRKTDMENQQPKRNKR